MSTPRRTTGESLPRTDGPAAAHPGDGPGSVPPAADPGPGAVSPEPGPAAEPGRAASAAEPEPVAPPGSAAHAPASGAAPAPGMPGPRGELDGAPASSDVSDSGAGSPSRPSSSAVPDSSAAPDLLYSDDEEDLRTAVRRLLDDHCTPAEVLARTESGAPHDRALWKLLAVDMGLAGLLVPERFGGQGATHREAAVVLEELGRSVAPVPFLTSAVMATEALLGCVAQQAAGASEEASADGGAGGGGGPAERVDSVPDARGTPAAELLAELATGRRVAVLAVPLAVGTGALAGPDGDGGAGCPRARHEDGTLHGRIAGVADAAAADVLLVPADTGLYAVETRQDGVVVAPRTSLDGTRPLADVTFTAARARALTARPQQALRRALDAGAGLLASEQLGVVDWCLTETVRYTRERHQFNRPVGSFQALKHRLAQLWLRTVHARAAARNAADALATRSPEIALAVALAQSCASDTAVHAAEEALQLHGGIGMTWEHPVHLYLKRAKADSIALGTAAQHRQRLASLADLAPPER